MDVLSDVLRTIRLEGALFLAHVADRLDFLEAGFHQLCVHADLPLQRLSNNNTIQKTRSTQEN